MVAGEASGDGLGAALMDALSARHAGLTFIGAGGPGMRARGLECTIATERLTMNGYLEPVLRLPWLLRARRRLLEDFARSGIQAFVGVDFNGFNLILERSLKRRGLVTCHYVSPAVYAWRAERLRRFHRAMDLVLTLYPFEPDLYADTPVEAVFVGHPLADRLAPPADRARLRAGLGVAESTLLLAVLPGSRPAELKRLLAPFVAAVSRVLQARADAEAVFAAVDSRAAAKISSAVHGSLPLERVRIVTGRSADVLAAADFALVKSGTGTLEAMLLGVPMVVAYRLDPLSARIVRARLRTPWVALPNILARESLVPELLQEDASGEALAAALLAQLPRRAELAVRFAALARKLRQNASERAADALLGLLQRRGVLQ